MIKDSSNVFISAATISVPLILIAFVISCFVKYQLGSILFVIGAMPIVIFSPDLFSSSTSGAIHTPKVVYRLVDTLTPNKKTSQGDDSRSRFNDSLSWVIAGLILWIISYFV
jgi:hypothetical protein